ncbi:Spartin [Oryzias melastigma]|uniref:Spartin n=1 Tax=Oryzias melastigma TaxID=30732 RepID=A0A834F237_ORYME|nr:Spartin [Oryzias melastigma]
MQTARSASPFPPGYLQIVTFSNQDQDSTDGNHLVLLDVCDQLYVLTKDTPVLLASSGIFMFPDPKTSESLVGIVLSSQLPAEEHEFFRDILSQLVNLQIQVSLHSICPFSKPKQQQQQKTFVIFLSKMVCKSCYPEDTEENCINLNEKVSLSSCNEDQKKEKKLRPKWSEKAGNAILSVGGMTAVSEQAGKALAPQVKKHGPKMVPKSLKESGDGRPSKADGAKFVAGRSAQTEELTVLIHQSLSTWTNDITRNFVTAASVMLPDFIELTLY